MPTFNAVETVIARHRATNFPEAHRPVYADAMRALAPHVSGNPDENRIGALGGIVAGVLTGDPSASVEAVMAAVRARTNPEFWKSES